MLWRVSGSAPGYHSWCNSVLERIKNDCACVTNRVFTGQRCSSGSDGKPAYPLTNPQTSPVHLRKVVDVLKDVDLGNQSPSQRNLHSLSLHSKCSSQRKELRAIFLKCKLQVNISCQNHRKEKKRKAIWKLRKILKSSPKVQVQSVSDGSS